MSTEITNRPCPWNGAVANGKRKARSLGFPPISAWEKVGGGYQIWVRIAFHFCGKQI